MLRSEVRVSVCEAVTVADAESLREALSVRVGESVPRETLDDNETSAGDAVPSDVVIPRPS